MEELEKKRQWREAERTRLAEEVSGEWLSVGKNREDDLRLGGEGIALKIAEWSAYLVKILSSVHHLHFFVHQTPFPPPTSCLHLPL